MGFICLRLDGGGFGWFLRELLGDCGEKRNSDKLEEKYIMW